MRSLAVKTILRYFLFIGKRFIISLILLLIMSINLYLKPDFNEKMGYWHADATNLGNIDIVVSLQKDGSAHIQHSIIQPNAEAPSETVFKSFDLVKTLRDGNYAFEYEYKMQRSTADSVRLSVRMEGVDLSKAAKWSYADGFHGAAGFQGREYIAQTVHGMRETDTTRIKILLTPDCFESLREGTPMYFVSKDLYQTDSERFSTVSKGNRSDDEIPYSLSSHYIKVAAKYLFIPLVIVLVTLYVLPLLSEKTADSWDEKDIPARLAVLKGTTRYVLLILLCEVLLVAAILINPLELRSKANTLLTTISAVPFLFLTVCTISVLHLIIISKKQSLRELKDGSKADRQSEKQ